MESRLGLVEDRLDLLGHLAEAARLVRLRSRDGVAALGTAPCYVRLVEVTLTHEL